MKTLSLSILSLSLIGCLQSGGGSGASVSAAPADSTPPAAPPSTPPSTPAVPASNFGLSYFSTKSLTSADGSISLSGGLLTDTYCGHTMQVISQSEASGSVTLTVTMLPDINTTTQRYPNGLRAGTSYTPPAHQNCLLNVYPLVWYYPEYSITAVYFGVNEMQPAWTVDYTMTESGGNVVVTRSLTSFPFRRATGRPTITGSVQPMNYSLQ